MKKLFIITTVPISLFFFKGQINYLKSTFDVEIVSSDEGSLFEIAKSEKVNYHIVNTKREISLFYDIKSLVNFIFLFIKQKPDIIHCNTPKGSLLALAAGYLVKVKKRIYFVHGLRYQGEKGIKMKILILMEKLSCMFATDIIAVSNGVKIELNKSITDKEILVVGYGGVNGIDLNDFNRDDFDKNKIRNVLEIDQNDFVFGFIGRIVKDKGINELVEAFTSLQKKYQNIKLLLVGHEENSSNQISNLTKKIIQENKDIIVLGYQKNVKPYFVAMDTFLFPSYREGFGMVLIEAGAMGLVSISSDIIGCNEIIEEGKNGFLITPKSVLELKRKMEIILSHREILIPMSIKAREIVEIKFNNKIVWKNYLETYKKISENV